MLDSFRKIALFGVLLNAKAKGTHMARWPVDPSYVVLHDRCRYLRCDLGLRVEQSLERCLPRLITQNEAKRRSLVSGFSPELILFHHLPSNYGAVHAKALQSLRAGALARLYHSISLGKPEPDTLRASGLPLVMRCGLAVAGSTCETSGISQRTAFFGRPPRRQYCSSCLTYATWCAARQRPFKQSLGRTPATCRSQALVLRRRSVYQLPINTQTPPFDLRSLHDCCRLHMANTLPKASSESSPQPGLAPGVYRKMYGELKTSVDELPPIPVPPPHGPHLLPPTPPSSGPLSLPLPEPIMPPSVLQSPGLSFAPGFLTPHSFASLTPPVVNTPGAHDIQLFHEVREAASSPTPLHEILRDPSVLSTFLSHHKKVRRGSSTSHTPRMGATSDAPSERERERDRDRNALKPEPSGSSTTSNSTSASSKGRTSSRERSRDRDRTRDRGHERSKEYDAASVRTADTASTVKPRKKDGGGDRDRETSSVRTADSTSTAKPRKRDRGRESDSASILTHVLAEEERQARHLKAVLRQTATRLEEEIRRADAAEVRARTAELALTDAAARLAGAEAARHQLELDATRAQEECRRWQMQADGAEREARRVQGELGRSERARAEADQAEREARDAARRAEQVLREWQAREEGREEVRRLEVRRRYSDGRDEGFEDGRAEGYEAGHQDGYEEGRDEGFGTGRMTGFEEGRKAGFEEGRKAGHSDGFQAGYSQGRKEERAKALEAFDRFIETEMDHPRRDRDNITDYEEEDRTKRWVEATRKTLRERDLSPLPPAPSNTTPPRSVPQLQPQGHLQAPEPQQHLIKSPPPPPPRPMPAPESAPPPYGPQVYAPPPPPQVQPQPQSQSQPRPQAQPQPVKLQAPQPVHAQTQREPSPAPKLVWLHRPLNHHREPSADASRTPLPILPLAEQRA